MRLHKTHSKGKEGEWTFDVVVEAKTVIGGRAFPLCSKHISYDKERQKQVSELACAKELIREISLLLPKYDICIAVDTLYVDSGFISLLKELKKDYICFGKRI